MPPATPAPSAPMSASTRSRWRISPVSSTAAPAASITNWAPTTARGTRRSPGRQTVGDATAQRAAAAHVRGAEQHRDDGGPVGRLLPGLAHEDSDHQHRDEIGGGRGHADHARSDRLVVAQPARRRSGEPGQHERTQRGGAPGHQSDRDVPDSSAHSVAEQPDPGPHVKRITQRAGIGGQPAENSQSGAEDPAGHGCHQTSGDGQQDPAEGDRGLRIGRRNIVRTPRFGGLQGDVGARSTGGEERGHGQSMLT